MGRLDARVVLAVLLLACSKQRVTSVTLPASKIGSALPVGAEQVEVTNSELRVAGKTFAATRGTGPLRTLDPLLAAFGHKATTVVVFADRSTELGTFVLVQYTLGEAGVNDVRLGVLGAGEKIEGVPIGNMDDRPALSIVVVPDEIRIISGLLDRTVCIAKNTNGARDLEAARACAAPATPRMKEGSWVSVAAICSTDIQSVITVLDAVRPAIPNAKLTFTCDREIREPH